MKKIIIALLASLAWISAFAQDINIPETDMKQKSDSVVKALQGRHSAWEFDSAKELTVGYAK